MHADRVGRRGEGVHGDGPNGEKGSSWAALGHAGWKGGGTAWARKVGSGPRERGKRVGLAQGEVGWALVWAAGFGLGWVSFPLFFSISYFKHHSNLSHLNSNLNLNPTLTFKQMKQCTNMNAQTSLNLGKFFNYL